MRISFCRQCGVVALFATTACAPDGEGRIAIRKRSDLGPAVYAHADLTVPVDSAQGAVLSADDALGAPTRIVVADSLLIVVDAMQPFAHILRRADGTVLRSFGRVGQGPGEFASIQSVALQPSRPLRLWVFDPVMRRLTHVDPDRGLSGPGIPQVIRLEGEGYAEEPVWIGTDTVATHSATDSTSVALFDLDGRLLSRVGAPIRYVDTTEVPAFVQAKAAQTRRCGGPPGTLVARVHQYAGRVDITTSVGTPVAEGKTPYPFIPAFDPNPKTRRLDFLNGSPNVRLAYLSCAATEKHVFALFSGRRMSSFPRYQRSVGEFVHVFEWSGRLARVIRLDVPALGIAVDPTGSDLYAVRFVPHPTVSHYRVQAMR